MDFSGFISLEYPQALVLLPLLYFVWRRLKVRNSWRMLMLAGAILLIGWPVLLGYSRNIDLFILVDRSRSISDESRKKQMELLGLAADNRRGEDRLAVVTFNERSYVEQAPDPHERLRSFNNPYSQDASDLAEGLKTTLGLIDPLRNPRILVLSDGEYTGENPAGQASLARREGVPIYYRNLKRTPSSNLAAAEIDGLDKVLTKEPFRLHFHVRSTGNLQGRYRVFRNGRLLNSSGQEGWKPQIFKHGDNLISLSDRLPRTGTYSYRIEVAANPKDSEIVTQDNSAEKFVQVVGERPVLVVNQTGGADNLTELLSAAGVSVHIASIGQFRLGAGEMEGYNGIVLNNVSILQLPHRQIEALRDFVLVDGGGLVICGGKLSYAQGGYYRSPLDPILPVSMEQRQNARKISSAFSIVLDRSGSMAMNTASGAIKMDLANHAAAESVLLMNEFDSVSVLAVDSAPHVIVPQQSVSDTMGMVTKIRSIESQGGGIFIHEALQAAGAQLVSAPQLNKHILLFADAADSEMPGNYVALLRDYRSAGITVSVVGLGSESDTDAALLKDIASRGGGSVYYTDDANQLVQFFTADTLTFTRNSYVEEPITARIRPGSLALSPRNSWRDFSAGGYNLLFPQPEADVAIQTGDEDKAPLLAFWQKGLGRVAALAYDSGGPFALTPYASEILLGMSRWAIAPHLLDNMAIYTTYEGSLARVVLETDAEEIAHPDSSTIELLSPSGKTIRQSMERDSLNHMTAVIKLHEIGLHRGFVRMGNRTYKTGPISLPVSPEFDIRSADFGKQTLAEIAATSGGRELADMRDLFQRDMKARVKRPLAPWLAALLLVLFLLDVAEPRLGFEQSLRRIIQKGYAFSAGFITKAKLCQRPRNETPVDRNLGTSDSPATETENAPVLAGIQPPRHAGGDAAQDDYLARSKRMAEKRIRGR